MEKKKTNKRQFGWLVSFMEKNPELARGGRFNDSRATSSWAAAQVSLNSLGPPTRSVAQWQKVWTDKKLQLKRKLQHNSNELRATGGGRNTQYSFTDLEEAIISLLSLKKTVDHDGSVFGIQLSTITPATKQRSETVDCDDDLQKDTSEPAQSDLPQLAGDAIHDGRQQTSRNRDLPNKRNYRRVLLEKQTDDFRKMKNSVSDCARFSRKMFEVEMKRLQLEEERFRFKKQSHLEERKYRSEEMQLKLEILKYKKQKLNFEMGLTTSGSTESTNAKVELQEVDSDDD